jgi:hypothetical protein
LASAKEAVAAVRSRLAAPILIPERQWTFWGGIETRPLAAISISR